MKPVPARIAVPFLLALLGVLFALGLLLDSVSGPVLTAAYVVVVLLALGAAAVVARRKIRAAAVAAGHTCACCTGTVHDPVQVI